MEEEFNHWIYQVCEVISKRSRFRRDAHDIYPTINLTEAKLSFIDGDTPEEYAYSRQL